MSAKELLLRVLLELRPMLPGTAAVVAASLLVLPTLLVCCKTAWVNDPRFRVAGLFFGLTGRDACFLSCAWIKLIVMLVFIVGFQKLVLVQYGMVLLPGILAAICARSGGQKTGTLLWLVLQMAGLLAVNLICGYIKDMAGGAIFVVLYVIMGLFLAMFSVYLFLVELNALSSGREVTAERLAREQQEAHTHTEQM